MDWARTWHSPVVALADCALVSHSFEEAATALPSRRDHYHSYCCCLDDFAVAHWRWNAQKSKHWMSTEKVEVDQNLHLSMTRAGATSESFCHYSLWSREAPGGSTSRSSSPRGSWAVVPTGSVPCEHCSTILLRARHLGLHATDLRQWESWTVRWNDATAARSRCASCTGNHVTALGSVK